MAPHVLLSSTVPVVILPPDAPRLLTANAAPTTLHAQLTHAPARDSLTLTLSDLSTRLLLLTYSLAAPAYTALRESQSLLIDFAAFPAHLCDLLRSVASADHHDFIATLTLQQPANQPLLELDNDAADDSNSSANEHVFTIIQTSAVKSITHIQLSLRKASHQQLVSTLAEGNRESGILKAANADLERRNAQLERRIADLSAERAQDVQRLTEELATMREGRASDAQRHAEELEAVRDELRTRQADAERNEATHEATRRELERSRVRIREREEQVAQLGAEAAESAADAGERERELEASTAEIERLRAASTTDKERVREAEAQLEQQRSDLAEVRRQVADHEALRSDHGRVQEALRKAQHEKRRRLGQCEILKGMSLEMQKAIARLEAEVARQKERCGVLTADKAALRHRLEEERASLQQQHEAAERRLEEMQATQSANEQVILYLNNELNERAIGEAGAGATRASSTGAARRPARGRRTPGPTVASRS